jgi:hypothetical protein
MLRAIVQMVPVPAGTFTVIVTEVAAGFGVGVVGNVQVPVPLVLVRLT